MKTRVHSFVMIISLLSGMAQLFAATGSGTYIGFSIDNRYSLATSSSGGGSVTTPGEGSFSYGHGTSVPLVAAPDPGYRVKSWSGTDNDSAKSETNTVLMISDKDVRVVFEAIPPAVQSLEVALADTVDPVDAGDHVTYTVTYGNAGQPDATGTVISEVLPQGLDFVSASGNGTYNATSRTIIWSIGTLPGETTGQTVTFVANVNSGLVEGGTFTHSNLTIACDEIDLVTAQAETTTVNDTQAPGFFGLLPGPNAEFVSRSPLIQLRVTDAGSGVGYDSGPVLITVGGDVIYNGAAETSAGVYDTSDTSQAIKGICRRAGTAAEYHFSFIPSSRFDFEQQVEVQVGAVDQAGNSSLTTYQFVTESRAFGANVKINSDDSTLAQDNPATAVDSSGNVWVVWDQATQTASDTDIYIGKLPDGASTFDASLPVYSGPAVQSHPVIAVDSDNRLYVAWQGNDASGHWDIFVSTSTDGDDWSDPIVVNTGDPSNTSDQTGPSIGIDISAPGTIYIAYQDDRAGNDDIWVSTSTDGVTWTETQVSRDPSDQTQPVVVIDPAVNTAFIFWTDARNAATSGLDIYGASAGTGTWTPMAYVAGSGNESSPAVALNGNAYLLWRENTGSQSDLHYAMTALQPLPLSGSSILDETDNTVAEPTLKMRVTVEETKLFAAWTDSRYSYNNNDTDIYYAESGSPFGTNILVNDDSGTAAQNKPAVGVANGEPYVVWVDERNGNKDIYYAGAMRIGDPLPTASPERKVDDQGNVSYVVRVDPASPDYVANLEVEVPEAAMPEGVDLNDITMAPVENVPEITITGGNVVGLTYEFGPSGTVFSEPVLIRIPLTEDPGFTEYRVYRLDPNDLASPHYPWTEESVHNPATRIAASGGSIFLEVGVDHFCIYGIVGSTVTPKYTLTVNSGSGDGAYAQGSVQTITADGAPSGMQFDEWTGDISHVDNVNAATTTVTMPAADVTVTATYEDLPLALPTVGFSLTSQSGSESESPAVLSVILSMASAQTVTVHYSIDGGSATGGGVDYTMASGALTFAPGETTEAISIPIVNDALYEAAETIVVSLDSPQNAQLGTNTLCSYAIIDDDALPVVSFTQSTSFGPEGTSPARLTVSLSSASGVEATVAYAVTGGTATPGGVDYTLAAGVLTFAPGGSLTQQIPITVVNDSIQEGDETIEIVLSNASQCTLGSAAEHRFTITDDEGPFQIISSQDVTVPAGSIAEMGVDYSTSDNDNALTGLTLRMHFDSTVLTYTELKNVFTTGYNSSQVQEDTLDLDGDVSTDKYVNILWMDPGGNWPGQAMPLKLLDGCFQVAEGLEDGTTTTLRFTGQTVIGYTLQSTPVQVTVGPSFRLDVDDNSQPQPLGDGILIIRYMAGFTGNALINGAVDPGGNRTDAGEIQGYLETGRDYLDIDGDGMINPLSDGILIIRYLAGFTGDALINGAVNPSGSRTNSQPIIAYLDAMK